MDANDKKIIAAQGPLGNTLEAFWRMVLQEKASLIVCVCKLKEGGRSKCHQYWPDEHNYKDFAAFESLRVRTLEEKQLSDNLFERYFEVTEGEKRLVVKQLHYVGWPDHGVPSGKSIEDFENLLGQFVDFTLNSGKDERAVVHCSAGIGRTGTIITLLHVVINICAQKNAGVEDPLISVFGTVRRLREQRMNLVQMPEQYVFIYQFLHYWLKKNNLYSPSQPDNK